MGPPGAGKGTQAKRLAEKFDMAHLSSGDIFRAEKTGGSVLGREMARYMDAGELVPDEIVIGVMTRAITKSKAPGGFLLDGFPRTVAQARVLDEQLSAAGAALDVVVVINAEDELIVERITGRRSCPDCGKVYHVKFMPPKRKGLCDACGVELVQRDDDSEAVVRQRLETYRRQTEPVIAYYRGRPGCEVLDIDGGANVDEVTALTVEALDGVKAKA